MAYTELVFILDKSGSMAGLEDDTIGGYNAMLAKQKEVEGSCLVTTVLFDHSMRLIHDRIDLRAVQPLTEKEYQVGGSTALLDAMGSAIQKISDVQEQSGEEYRADKVLFVIITDGCENSSRDFSPNKVKALVEEHKEQGWEFVFLGANMDAIAAASSYGISADRAQSYHSDHLGVALNFAVMSDVVASYRRTGVLDNEWKKTIASDFERRKKS
ncbi:MAG TPA: hypothetical protein GX014_09055 [Firmicutes bacterium]|jgi:uncharacterized protein YegL|nr:hypothetical protein [Bacillota bacterium]HHT43529.1 hypothetical protein [Bacillota bacterium]